MVVRYVRAVRPVISSITRQTYNTTSRRSLFAPSAVRSADLVQQMYLKELQSFKPTPVKANDAEGQVSKFAIPKPPTSPEESNIANELKEYETMAPEIEGNTADGVAVVEEDWFEEEEEEHVASH